MVEQKNLTTTSDWTWKRSVDKAHGRLQERGLHRLPSPNYRYEDLGEINSIEEVSDVALANMMLRHQAWYSYATVELSYAKAAYASFEEIYEVLLGTEMNRISKTQEGRLVKDVLKSLAIKNNESLKDQHRRKVELLQDVQLLEGMVQGLSIRCRALESESIRRASVRKIER